MSTNLACGQCYCSLLAVSFHFNVRVTLYKFIVLYCSLNLGITLRTIKRELTRSSLSFRLVRRMCGRTAGGGKHAKEVPPSKARV